MSVSNLTRARRTLAVDAKERGRGRGREDIVGGDRSKRRGKWNGLVRSEEEAEDSRLRFTL